MHRAARATGLALGLLLASWAVALPDDAAQPIEIESDSAELDEVSGVAVYAGNVRMRQGTMIVTAETLTIRTADDAVTRIVADGDGEPATFVYVTNEERIEFEGEAELAQSTDRFEGDRITYDLRERRVNARAGSDGERMTFVLDPARMRTRREGDSGDPGDDG
jgi:lipopolysaccharide export system protein LptA